VGQPVSRRARAGALAHRDQLKGKNLACWCALDEPCRGDALLRFAADESTPQTSTSTRKLEEQ
jgi:hypothetical protein